MLEALRLILDSPNAARGMGDSEHAAWLAMRAKAFAAIALAEGRGSQGDGK